jgi:hypothetical protein
MCQADVRGKSILVCAQVQSGRFGKLQVAWVGDNRSQDGCICAILEYEDPQVMKTLTSQVRS